jgi:nitrile hydratase
MTNNHSHDDDPRDAELSLRTRALEALLGEKGLVTSAEIDRITRTFEQDIGPLTGARVVARAWSDSAYRARLLFDGNAAIAELGFHLETRFLVLENTPSVHNVIVCTLCSCYPWALLGLPPGWYRSPEYRSRVVIAPRDVLREFGLDLAEMVQIRVWDSSAETRYMVLPERPPGTEGWSEERLAALVTRDAMTGVARVAAPAEPVAR